MYCIQSRYLLNVNQTQCHKGTKFDIKTKEMWDKYGHRKKGC